VHRDPAYCLTAGPIGYCLYLRFLRLLFGRWLADRNRVGTWKTFFKRECWYATTTTTFSGTVTANMSTGTYAGFIIVWGISGAHTSSPWDSNASLTCVTANNTATTAVPTCSTTTSSANDFIFSVIFETDGTNQSGWGNQTGYTTIEFVSCFNSNFAQCYGQVSYDIVSSTQAAVAIGFTTTSTQNILFVDAVQQAGSGPSASSSSRMSLTGAGN
jgi:hypothetical protein